MNSGGGRVRTHRSRDSCEYFLDVRAYTWNQDKKGLFDYQSERTINIQS